jgi:DNA-nicking Smr family endonuclease
MDLHGQTVAQAVETVKKTLETLAMTNVFSLKIVVGRGAHSANGQARVGPKVRLFLEEQNIRFTNEPDGGSLVVPFA